MVGVLMSTGLTAYATSSPAAVNIVTKDLADVERPERGERPDRPELTEEERTERVEWMKTRLSERLANGQISQEHYDQVMKDIEEGLRPRGPGNGRGGDGDCPMERPERPDRPEGRGQGRGPGQGRSSNKRLGR